VKVLAFFAVMIISASAATAQLNPVGWAWTAKKISDKKYEVRLTATIQSGWHLYSQSQPDDAIAEPTSVSFNKNPLLSFDGKLKEEGKLEKFHDAKLDISAHQYSTKVEFVQEVKLKAAAKTNVTGTVRFQTCNDEKCLPPKTLNFSIPIK
jgi:hypothetical protein